MASSNENNVTNTRQRDDRKCALCTIHLRKTSGQKKIISTEIELEYAKRLSNIENININDVVCNSCGIRMIKDMSRSNTINPGTTSENISSQESCSSTLSQLSISESSESLSYKVVEKEEPKTVELSITRTIATHKYCFICGFQKQSDLILVPLTARVLTFSRINLFIPKGNRCCRDHLIRKKFFEEDWNKIKIFSNTSVIEVTELPEFLNEMSARANETLLDKTADFDMPEKKLKILTGSNWEKWSSS